MALAEIEIPANTVHYQFDIDGDDSFKVKQFELSAGMGELGSFTVKLLNADTSREPSKYLTKKATLEILCGTADNRTKKKFHGYLRQFELEGVDSKAAHFSAVIVPRFWKLTQKKKCRVHVTDRDQNKTIKEVIKKVLQEAQIDADSFAIKLSESYEPYSFLVQYQESDFDFLCRICEEEGVAFFLDHQESKEVLTFVDQNQKFEPAWPFDEVLFGPTTNSSNGASYETLTEFRLACHVQHGATDMRAYDFKQSHKIHSGTGTGKSPAELEDYEFPVHFQDQEDPAGRMKRLANVRAQEFDAQTQAGEGSGDFRGFWPGRTFTLKEHPSSPLNQKYLCTSVSMFGTESAHVGVGDAPVGMGASTFGATVRCIPMSIPYRPPRRMPAPRIFGTQTAVVVGPPGEEIHTDKFGRVKVQFHWDREGKRDDKSSFWIRTMQANSGRKYGSMMIPRVGWEVVVAFIEGDPNNPIVVGSVYNDYQRVPYLLPENKTRSVILKSNSTPGGDGFNELRFEDKKGKEQIFLHAEKDLDVRVKDESREHVEHHRHLIVGKEDKKSDQKELIWRDKLLKIKRHQQEHIEGNFKLRVGEGDEPSGGNVDVVIEKDRKENVGQNQHLKVGQKMVVDVGQAVQVKAGQKVVLASGMQMHVVGKTLVIEGEMDLTLKGPGGFINIGPAGVAIQGTMVLINSGGAAGAGPGATESVQEAKKAEPEAPDKADDDKTGEKSPW